MYWAMRTSRDTDEYRKLVTDELFRGRLRQGWGWLDEQDLRRIHEAWRDGIELTQHQKDASRHWRMADGDPGEYMNVNDVILVPNMPEDGVFTLCRICGGYEYQQNSSWDDFRHVREVEVLTPGGVANEHELVDAGLRRSLRYQGRLWRIASYGDCIERILASGRSPDNLRLGSTPAGRAESIVAAAIVEPINVMAQSLASSLPQKLYGAEWEQGIAPALESLFTATVHHTGGPGERGADLEVVISNPFEEGCDWIIPVQVKDHQDVEGTDVVHQLEEAFESRNSGGRGTVIAVVLLVTEAEASVQLKEEMNRLSKEHDVPFLYCGRSDFMQVLAKGFLRRI